MIQRAWGRCKPGIRRKPKIPPEPQSERKGNLKARRVGVLMPAHPSKKAGFVSRYPGAAMMVADRVACSHQRIVTL